MTTKKRPGAHANDSDGEGVTTARARIEPGAIFDERYRLDAQIGRGSMGVVYLATDLKLERPVALKVLAETSSDERRLQSEVRALARLSHPNLVRVYDAGEADGDVYLVMELIGGTTLAEQLQHGALSTEVCGRIGAGVAAALAYVHRRGIVHRDVKPANILIDEEGTVRLADFGIARLVDSAGITATGSFIGTPAYLAPEQVRASGVGPPADVFALGLVLLECLTGSRAYRGTPTEVAASRLHASPEIPQQIGPPLRDLLAQMTALDPQKRPSAERVASFFERQPAVAPALDDPAAETVSDTKAISQVTDTATHVVAPVVLAASRRDPWRRVRRHRVPIAVAASVLAAFGLGLGLGSTFTSGPTRGAAGAALHHGKSKHPSSKSDPSTTSTSTSTSTSTTTTTSPPLTDTRAASRLDAAIERGVAKGTIPAPLAQQLTNLVQPLIVPTPDGNSPQTAQSFDQLVQAFDQSVTNGQVSDPATVDQIDSALTRLAATLGVAMPPSTTTTTGPTPGQGYPFGDSGYGTGGDGNGDNHGQDNG